MYLTIHLSFLSTYLASYPSINLYVNQFIYLYIYLSYLTIYPAIYLLHPYLVEEVLPADNNLPLQGRQLLLDGVLLLLRGGQLLYIHRYRTLQDSSCTDTGTGRYRTAPVQTQVQNVTGQLLYRHRYRYRYRYSSCTDTGTGTGTVPVQTQVQDVAKWLSDHLSKHAQTWRFEYYWLIYKWIECT